MFLDELDNRIRRTLAQLPAVHVNAAHARVCRERDEARFCFGYLTAAQAVLLLRQDNDRAAFGCLVRKAGELSSVRQFAFACSIHRDEFDSLAVTQSDGACFIEQERIDIAGSFYGFSA